MSYFILVNFFNLIYLRDANFFSFQALFLVVALFLYAGLYRSVSVKIMIHLFFSKKDVILNNFYQSQFKEKSFNKRIKILISNGFLLKKKKYLFLSLKGKKYLKAFKIVQSIYKIESSG